MGCFWYDTNVQHPKLLLRIETFLHKSKCIFFKYIFTIQGIYCFWKSVIYLVLHICQNISFTHKKFQKYIYFLCTWPLTLPCLIWNFWVWYKRKYYPKILDIYSWKEFNKVHKGSRSRGLITYPWQIVYNWSKWDPCRPEGKFRWTRHAKYCDFYGIWGNKDQ